MKLKIFKVGEKEYAEIQDGKPIFIEENGTEVPVDVPAVRATVTRLSAEAKGFREAKEALEAKLKPFDGIEDPAAALKALETIKNVETGQLIAAGKVEEIKAAAQRAADEKVAATSKQFQTELDATKADRDKFKGDLFAEKIGGAFARSKFIAEKVAVPPDMLQALFGRQFTIEDNKIVARDAAGNPINSSTKFTEPADFDEAIEIIVKQYPNRDRVLKGANSSGSGARHSANGNGNGAAGKTMTREEFNKLPPLQQAMIMQPSNKERPTIIDAA